MSFLLLLLYWVSPSSYITRHARVPVRVNLNLRSGRWRVEQVYCNLFDILFVSFVTHVSGTPVLIWPNLLTPRRHTDLVFVDPFRIIFCSDLFPGHLEFRSERIRHVTLIIVMVGYPNDTLVLFWCILFEVRLPTIYNIIFEFWNVWDVVMRIVTLTHLSPKSR